jgi:hypothetical protein
MKRITNKDARDYIQTLSEFKGSNIFSMKHYNGTYAVYSYGSHFPMFVFKGNKWYENSDKYSMSTSKQQNQCRPDLNCIKKTTEEMKELLR